MKNTIFFLFLYSLVDSYLITESQQCLQDILAKPGYTGSDKKFKLTFLSKDIEHNKNKKTGPPTISFLEFCFHERGVDDLCLLHSLKNLSRPNVDGFVFKNLVIEWVYIH